MRTVAPTPGLVAVALFTLAYGLATVVGLVVTGNREFLFYFVVLPVLLVLVTIVHAFGFGVTTWICWQALKRYLADPRPRFGPRFLCAVAGLGFGATVTAILITVFDRPPETAPSPADANSKS